MAMNATRTTPRQALPRWQRGIVRAVLLIGALAGMTLVSTAHAQIAFRSSSSAFISGGPMTPALRAAAAGGPPMTVVGESRMPASDDAITTATSASITPPSGMQANDVILVFVSAMVPSTVSITNSANAGQTCFTILAFGGNPYTNVYRCIFTGTWSGNPAWSWGATAATYQIWMVVLRGVDTAGSSLSNMIDGNLGQATDYKQATFTAPASPFDVTIPAGQLTTSTDNAMVFAQWYSADDNTWALQTPGWSNLGGQAQWRTMAAAGGAGADSSTSIAYLTQATARPVAAVDNQQTSPAASPASDAGQWRIFAMRPAGIRKPPGTVAGDVMIASIAFGLNSTITPPAGWTLVRRIDQASGSTYSMAIYRRTADASDASVSSYVFGLSNANNGWVGGIQSISGVDTTTPIDVENGQVTASALTHATPSVTTTGANRLLVTTHMVYRGNITGWTPPAGMTETLDFRTGRNIGPAIETSNVVQATA